MISTLRHDFNTRFREKDYRHLLHSLDACAQTRVAFRVAETPVFLPEDLLNSMARIGVELTYSLLDDQRCMAASAKTVPEAFHTAAESRHPHFMTADFGLVPAADGSFQPMLVELQAFPSLFAFQFLLAETLRTVYQLDPSLCFFLGGHTESTFWKKFAQTVLRNHAPENVVLLEIDPQRQKTLADFNLTADRLGIRVLDIAELVPEDRPGRPPRLCYRNGRHLVPIHRIYNRVVPEQFLQQAAQAQDTPAFRFAEPFDVEWAGHPSWYFRLSKFSLPWLDHPSVPPAVFLDQWFAGTGRDRLPGGLAQCVLKPLFSYAGQGIRFAPSQDDLNAIPPAKRSHYLLQQRVDFARTIDTPAGPTQPEVRILYLWPDGGHLEPVLSLVRLGRGLMMGVDHSENLPWTGVSTAFFSPSAEK